MDKQITTNEALKGLIINALNQSFINSITPHSLDSKRPTVWHDYGYPVTPTFSDYWSAYRRGGIGHAGVVRHIQKTWQTYPQILEREEEHETTSWERQLDELFERIDFWKMLKGTDERNRVGKYAGLIFMFADGKRPDQPVEMVQGGINGLVKVIPCYESQLEPSEWDTNPNSLTYGEPTMYYFNETEIGDHSGQNPGRTLNVHPSRVHIWAEGADDGTIYGIPALEAGLNDLITIEKIIGACGEGFWKTARAPMKMNIDKDAQLQQLATMLGTDIAGIADKMDEVVADFMSGADKSFLTQAIDMENLTISLPRPKEFFDVALQSFAASVDMPLPILLGHQTGERASQEDSNEWASTIMARRSSFVVPEIKRIIRKLMDVGIIRARETFHIEWDDLTEQTFEDKLANAKTMSDVNRNMLGSGEGVPFTAEQIAKTAGIEYEADAVPTFGEDE